MSQKKHLPKKKTLFHPSNNKYNKALKLSRGKSIPATLFEILPVLNFKLHRNNSDSKEITLLLSIFTFTACKFYFSCLKTANKENPSQ
eukprot:c43367_g1_i1 orf=83-346(+)